MAQIVSPSAWLLCAGLAAAKPLFAPGSLILTLVWLLASLGCLHLRTRLRLHHLRGGWALWRPAFAMLYSRIGLRAHRHLLVPDRLLGVPGSAAALADGPDHRAAEAVCFLGGHGHPVEPRRACKPRGCDHICGLLSPPGGRRLFRNELDRRPGRGQPPLHLPRCAARRFATPCSCRRLGDPDRHPGEYHPDHDPDPAHLLRRRRTGPGLPARDRWLVPVRDRPGSCLPWRIKSQARILPKSWRNPHDRSQGLFPRRRLPGETHEPVVWPWKASTRW